MKLKPTGKHAVVRIVADPEQEGLIYVPDTKPSRRYVKAKLLSLGPDCDLAGLRPGGFLWVHGWGGEVVKIDSRPVMVITERDIAGIVL